MSVTFTCRINLHRFLKLLRPPRQPAPPTPGETSVPAPVERSAEVRERLDTMKQAARAHEQTDMELTAADINALIAANRKSRGTASVGIDGGVAQAQFSIPLERLDVPFRNAFGLGDRLFERHRHDRSAAGNQRQQRAAERGEDKRP